MDFTAEQIGKVASFAGVTQEEARAALERAGGSPLDAVLLLERGGRSSAPAGGAWSTRAGAQPEREAQPPAAAERPAVRTRPVRRKYTAREVGDAVKSFLRGCTKITVDIWREGDLLAGVPLVVCVLLFVVAFWLMLALTLVGLVLRCRYHISGWEGNAEPFNRAMDRVTETVSGWTDEAKAKWKDCHGKSTKR